MKNNSYVFASFLNHNIDSQRDVTWQANTDSVMHLIKSTIDNGCKIKIFHNCFYKPPIIDNLEWVRVEPDKKYMPNVARWFHYKDYLSNHKEIESVFCVDSTDVKMLRNPFNEMEDDILYVGNECDMKVENDWMKRNQEVLLSIPDYRKIIKANREKTLINCGLVGGNINIMKEYLDKLCDNHEKYSSDVGRSTDMAIFNYTIWKHFSDRIFSGEIVNTRFKYNETNEISWWKHK